MYEHLLVPIDGGELSERAMTASIELAKKLGASITGFIAEPFTPPFASVAAGHHYRTDVERHDALVQAHAENAMSRFEQLSRRPVFRFAASAHRAPMWTMRSSRQQKNIVAT